MRIFVAIYNSEAWRVGSDGHTTNGHRTGGWSKNHRNCVKGSGRPTNREKLPKIALVVGIGPFSGTLRTAQPARMRQCLATIPREVQSADCLLERAGFELPRPLVVKADF